jgi:hypothetical protein
MNERTNEGGEEMNFVWNGKITIAIEMNSTLFNQSDMI